MTLAVRTENPMHSMSLVKTHLMSLTNLTSSLNFPHLMSLMSLAKTHLRNLRSLVNSPSFPSLLACLSSDVICGLLIRSFKKFDGAGPLPLTLRRRRSYFFGELSRSLFIS